jgi:hypothetical protein
MLEILDSLIATITVVLVLSLIVQAIQQIIKQAWSFKSSYMEKELYAMFRQSSDAPKKGHAPNFLIRSIKWIYDVVVPTSMKFRIQNMKETETGKIVDAIKEKVAGLGYDDLSLLETLSVEEVKKIVGSLDFDAQKLESLKDEVANWYDLTLKAFQDHYERKMKAWSYVLSFIVVIWLDANVFEIHKEFSSNKVLRDSAVKMAERLTSIPRDSLIVVNKKGSKDSLSLKIDTLAAQVVERQIARIDSLVNNGSFQIMRWNAAKGDSMRSRPLLGKQILPSTDDLGRAAKRNLFGWLAMTLLVGLGAPFWYDFLKTVMGIKNTLNKRNGAGKNPAQTP